MRWPKRQAGVEQVTDITSKRWAEDAEDTERSVDLRKGSSDVGEKRESRLMANEGLGALSDTRGRDRGYEGTRQETSEKGK